MSGRAIVFDIGNVLLRWDMRNLFAKHVPAEQLDWFLANVCTLAWHGRLDAGATYAEAIAQLTERFPDHAEVIALYDSRWQETIAGPIDGSVDMLHSLRASGLRTFAITNFPAEKFDETCRLYPFLNGFEGVIVSGRERLTKPDPAIFRLFLERFGLRAADCVFIDDSPANVNAAASLGMAAVRFEHAKQLRGDLRALDLPV